ncbi:MAG: hypothetical protein LCH74_03745 [Proteobacteria bacterium]|nr:hypothetical protein [Pseudomonadota bacterium]
MTKLSDHALRVRIAELEAINRTRSLTQAESQECERLVHIHRCRVNARQRSIERNAARLSLLTGGLPA